MKQTKTEQRQMKQTKTEQGQMKTNKNKARTNENKQKCITTSIFGFGRCEAAHKYENGDSDKNITKITNRNINEKYQPAVFLKKARQRKTILF